MSGPLLQPEDQVLSTLNADGSRRWIKPRLAPGRFLSARRAVAWFLIVLFCTLPHITINDKPAVLLDAVRREYTLFGKTFLPTDTVLFMLLIVGIGLSIFLITALFGRVWCGWGCPQTVYMEFVFRPLERLFDGAPGRPAPTTAVGLRKALKYLCYFLISIFLAHTFLAYFVSFDALRHWVFHSPSEHPFGFGLVVFVTAMMMFDFSFFREQTCIVACPYGRFQSALLDRDSLIITYDTIRGEPRGKAKRSPAPESISLNVLPSDPASTKRGDCVDCGMCVAVCPTGIDIRKGLQLECIGCAQCIDACDSVMTKIKRPTGLIRYSSQNAVKGQGHLIRPRVLIYPLVILIIAGVFVWRILTAAPADVMLLRQRGLPFNTLASGEVTNQLSVKVTNREREKRAYTIDLSDQDKAAGVSLVLTENPLVLNPGEMRAEPFVVHLKPGALHDGKRTVTFLISAPPDFSTTRTFQMLGPGDDHKPAEHKDSHHDDDSKKPSNP